METEFKGTPGPHVVMYAHGVCIGVGAKESERYYKTIANTILPDTDEQYNSEKKEMIANMQLYAAAPDLLESLQDLICSIEQFGSPANQSVDKAKAAIQKALNL